MRELKQLHRACNWHMRHGGHVEYDPNGEQIIVDIIDELLFMRKLTSNLRSMLGSELSVNERNADIGTKTWKDRHAQLCRYLIFRIKYRAVNHD
jgi:hypothetical protein